MERLLQYAACLRNFFNLNYTQTKNYTKEREITLMAGKGNIFMRKF